MTMITITLDDYKESFTIPALIAYCKDLCDTDGIEFEFNTMQDCIDVLDYYGYDINKD
jgi:hypothetical protein